MKSITRRKALPLAAASLASAVANRTTAAAPAKPSDENCFPVFSPDFDTLKRSDQLLDARWWTVKFEGRIYYFCRVNLPFIAVSRYDVHGWYQAAGDGDQRLFHVWSVRTHGIGDIRLDIDEAAGTVSVVALERKMKGKQVAFYALRAADP